MNAPCLLTDVIWFRAQRFNISCGSTKKVGVDLRLVSFSLTSEKPERVIFCDQFLFDSSLTTVQPFWI